MSNKMKKKNVSQHYADDYENIHSTGAKCSLYKEFNENLARKALSSHELFAEHLKEVMKSAPAFRFSSHDVQIQTSEAKEAKDGGKKFANTFIRTSAPGEKLIEENKGLLRTRSSCANWTTNNKEADDFIASPIVKTMQLEVSFRLGFNDKIPMDTIMTMYESCVFWNLVSLSSERPPFCAAFTPTHLKIIEYWLDLKHYYEFGYGNEFSEKMGCVLVENMINRLYTASKGIYEEKLGTAGTYSDWTGKRVNINIGDEENLMGMITKMGLYKDEEAPKYDNYYWKRTNRKWRSSLLSPFDRSVHAVLYNCKNNEKKVEFYHNHEIVKFDACKNSQDGKCPFETFYAEISKIVEHGCDVEYCGSFPQNPSGSGSGSTMISFSFIVMLLSFLFNRLNFF